MMLVKYPGSSDCFDMIEKIVDRVVEPECKKQCCNKPLFFLGLEDSRRDPSVLYCQLPVQELVPGN